jgi:hypothetical protein
LRGAQSLPGARDVAAELLESSAIRFGNGNVGAKAHTVDHPSVTTQPARSERVSL